MTKLEMQRSLGVPVRTDGLPRNWILSDSEYLTAPRAVVLAIANYERLRNQLISEAIERDLRDDFAKLREPKFWTWDSFRLDREVAYAQVYERKYPRLTRECVIY